MELSRKKQIKRRLLPGFENGLDYINYNYQALYNPYVGVNYNPNQWNLRINTKDFMPTLNPKTDMPVYTKFPIPGENKRRSYSDVNIPAILGFGADVYNQFLYNKTANDMITDAGTSSGNVEGVGYTRYNPVDINKPVSEVLRSRDLDTVNTGIKGALIGSEILPGAGTILGGIFGLGAGILGGHKRKKEAEETAKRAAVLAQNLTTNNRAGAQTEALQQDYALHAAGGKDESDTNVLPEVQNLYDAGALPLVTVSGKRRKSTGTYSTSSKSMLPSLSEMLRDNFQYLFMKDFGMLNNDDYLSYMHYNMLKNPRGRLLMPYFKYEDGKDLDGYTYDPELDNLVITPTEELNSVHKQNRENIKNAKLFIQDWTANRFWRNYDKSKNVLSYTDDPNYIKSQFNDAQKRYLKSLLDLNNAIILTPDSEDDAFLYGTTKEQMLKNFEDEEETYGYYDPLSTKYGRPVIYLRNSSTDPNVVLHELTHASGLAYTDTPYTDYPNMDVGRESYIKDDVKWRLNLNNRYYNYLTGNDEPTARLMVLRKYLKDAGYDLHPDRDMTELELDAILNDSNIMNDQKVKDMNIFNMFYDGKLYDKDKLLDFMNTVYTNPLTDVYRAHKGKDEGVYTANGIFNMQPNAVGQKDEALMENLDPEHPENASATVIKDGKGGVDDVPLNVKPGTKIGGNDIDWNTGISFKKEILPLATILEYMKKKYYNNLSNLSSLSKPTQRVLLNEANKVLSGVVKNLKAYTDLLKWQHDITGYNQPMTAARGKDRTIPPMLPSASVLQMMDYLFAAGDRDVANGRLGDEQSYQHRKYVEESGKDLYNFGEKHKKDYKSLPKKATIFNTLKNLEYYQLYLDALKKYPTVDDYINGEMNEYRKYWLDKKEQSENRMKSNYLFGEFANGKDYHTIPNALGALASIGQMIQAGKQSIKTSNSYAPNKYTGRALNTLASLDINEQPGLQLINKAARYADYGVNNSGGLSGSQKYLGRLANANNVYTNYLKFLSDVQAQRNAYKSQYASTAATIGAQEAQNRLNANQWDLDYYSRAHAARLGGIQMGVRNLMDYINHWSADASKLNQFNKMYDLYAMDVYNNANKYR